MKAMKVAVCHDRLMERSGGERVAIVLAKTFNADLFVAKYDAKNTFSFAKKLNVKAVSPSAEPPVSQLYTLVWMRDAIKFSKLEELKDYDLLITSGQLAHFASVQNPRNIWYCHTPNRALYDLRDEVRGRLSPFWKPLFNAWARFWKPFDQTSVKSVNKIVVNSNNVKKRVRKFYNRNSDVVYPPVDLREFRPKPSENYWLSVQRMEPEKRIEIQLKVFEKFPKEKLVLVGPGRYGKEYLDRMDRWVKRMPNVTWKRNVSDRELTEIYSRCKAVIQTPIDEDFGLTAIEAMASGKPCIAVDEGGFKETILPGKTGLLVKEPYVQNFAKIVKNFDDYSFDPKTCVKRAREFSEEEFMRKMKDVAKEVVEGPA
jgi:glycosyltransferase involved in cell wall biosynthesis